MTTYNVDGSAGARYLGTDMVCQAVSSRAHANTADFVLRLGFGRPSATPSERYLRRAHQRVRDARSVIEDPATDVLHSLSDHPLNSFHTSRRERSPPSGLDSQRRQTKRRRLDHSATPVSEYDGFRYGYKGQVARGRLRMEVVSCDGGEYDRDSSLYRVQNVLSNDKSVYCSQTGSCNILLRHIGEMPFCLEKMVIRAPDRGFTAPVQEGLVFVAMSPDKLLSGTSAYEIEYYTHDSNVSPPSPSPSLPRGEDDGEMLSFQEAMQDEAVWDSLAERMLHSQRPRTTDPARVARDQRDEQLGVDDEEDVVNECPYHIEEGDANAAGISAPTPPPFTTTMESEPEDSEESEALPSAAVMADRLRRESRYRSEGEDDDDRDELIHQPPAILRRAEPLGSPRLRSLQEQAQRWRTLQHVHNIDPIRATRLRTPSRIEPKLSRPESENIIQPHARFFIARHKNKITIKFHPAISGKHVLLKLWSPTHDGNIDIESVQFYGYSGPRFFPAVQPR
ncbi:hypothetical protein P171DRAFT_442551 [Karstenula rhodostoma CBS 690.94]|uniref:Uncharacterized protein n=1 Tax=Karstenula rhodostoma CBS 690.94 TaxID=1392251 RepID=A0A9P4PNF9_9PLEO|nr:hypothetical protein P171DRAFT_442551 [Karstenula rhodostoma CBS 690.94]